MVVAWEIRNIDGGLISTFFKEREALTAKEKLEKQGHGVKMVKVFDHHLKDREPVVKARSVPDLIPEGTRFVKMYIKPGDLITSELGIGFTHKGGVVHGVTRAIVTDGGKLVPVIRNDEVKQQ